MIKSFLPTSERGLEGLGMETDDGAQTSDEDAQVLEDDEHQSTMLAPSTVP